MLVIVPKQIDFLTQYRPSRRSLLFRMTHIAVHKSCPLVILKMYTLSSYLRRWYLEMT